MTDSNWQIKLGTRVTDDIQKQLNAMPKKTVVVTPILDNRSTQIGTKTLTQYSDALGNVTTATKKTYANTKETTNEITKLKSSVDTTSKSIQTASKHTATLGSRFVDITKKVAAFGAVTAMIGLFTRAISEGVKAVINMNKVQTEFKKVSDLNGNALSNYTKKLGEMGTEVARTASEMLSASTEFVKSGYTEEQSANLANVASLYQNIADAEVSASDASSLIISQMKAFGISAENAVDIINQINEVSNRFAVSSTDISTALTKSSSALSVYGNTMSQSIALTTAG
jgi:hypothetical protein